MMEYLDIWLILKYRDFPWFAQESRNVCLGLATNGFNPLGNMSNSYSMWLVILIPYNLPAWRHTKENFLMMSLLIRGPNDNAEHIWEQRDCSIKGLGKARRIVDFVRMYDVSVGHGVMRGVCCLLWPCVKPVRMFVRSCMFAVG